MYLLFLRLHYHRPHHEILYRWKRWAAYYKKYKYFLKKFFNAGVLDHIDVRIRICKNYISYCNDIYNFHRVEEYRWSGSRWRGNSRYVFNICCECETYDCKDFYEF